LKKARKSKCIDIYSSPTLDYRYGRRVLGGPLYYAQLALRKAGHITTVRWALRCLEDNNPYTIFEVEDNDGYKKLKLIVSSKWSCPLPSCDAALFSPVYHDFPLHIIQLSRLYKHCILDVQGIVRIAGKSGIVDRYARITHIDAENCIVKIGIDDVTSFHDVEHLLSALRPRRAIFTADGRGFIIIDNDENIVTRVTLRAVNVESVGAGDMFNALTLSHMLDGVKLEEAAIKAAEEVAQILASTNTYSNNRFKDSQYVRNVTRLPSTSSYLNEIIRLAIDG
jgi:sugar/nucleoside kinase (ribokinase family)